MMKDTPYSKKHNDQKAEGSLAGQENIPLRGNPHARKALGVLKDKKKWR